MKKGVIREKNDRLPENATLMKTIKEQEGISQRTLSRRANYRKIPAHFVFVNHQWERFFYPDEIEKLLAKKVQTFRNAQKAHIKNYFKVSTWDELQGCYMVKHCGLSKAEAYRTVNLYKSEGKVARMTPHIKD